MRTGEDDRQRRFLAAVGDCNDPETWSGIPYYFLQAAKPKGLLDEGLALAVRGNGWRLRRWAWNAWQVLCGDRYGGFQYSVAFLERLWAPQKRRLHGAMVVNCFQLYPPSVVSDSSVQKWYFIDQTLLQLFGYYGCRHGVGRRIADEAIARERDGYGEATGVIVHSRWAARSLTEDYGIPAERVHVVPVGPSIDTVEYERWERENLLQSPKRSDGPLRLVFVGKEWRRKGLDRLLCAVTLARQAGAKLSLRVIGCERGSLPRELRELEGVEWLGYISKRRECARFIRAVGECDVGCLLSRAEAGGVVLREYHALGLVTLGPDTGGARDHMIEGASIAVSPTAADSEIAELLIRLERDEAWFSELRMNAWRSRHLALWENSVRQMSVFWHAASAQALPRPENPDDHDN